MSGPDAWNEFEIIGRLFRPLAEGAPEALELKDDAAVIAGRPGYDLVVTADSIVEGVHFLAVDPPDLVARKLLRVNLSDLAAKGARPYGYFLSVAWPRSATPISQELFAAGLAKDQRAFGVKLFGGDTTATPGPWTLSATMLGWVRTGQMTRRSGARDGDLLLVSGTIGDGFLGLKAAQGRLAEVAPWQAEALALKYRLPTPRLDLAAALAGAHAAADVSDGLIADAGHLASASGLGVDIDLDRMPLSPMALDWAGRAPDVAQALVALATGGDDYELVCAAPAELPGFTAIGRFTAGQGIRVRRQGRLLEVARPGYDHGRED